EVGTQAERIGPIPTVRNTELTFSETSAGTTDMDQYATSYRCLIDGQQVAQGNATEGTVTIPSEGQDVDCVFYNAPLIANVTIEKQVADTEGQNPQPRANWTVGATAQATQGGVNSTPTTATQQTNNDGVATWDFQFDTQDDSATLSVLEEMESGYVFGSAECRVVHLDGTQNTVTVDEPTETAVGQIIPGDRVECTYINHERVPDTLQVQKNIVGLAHDTDNFVIS